ncbi:MAG: hypothetical protein P1U46_00540 [Patescibacteria group bacterium]|nr:hypothetical protein [Patescibacteria group bacterium]
MPVYFLKALFIAIIFLNFFFLNFKQNKKATDSVASFWAYFLPTPPFVLPFVTGFTVFFPVRIS